MTHFPFKVLMEKLNLVGTMFAAILHVFVLIPPMPNFPYISLVAVDGIITC
jgi:hypothetical protein